MKIIWIIYYSYLLYSINDNQMYICRINFFFCVKRVDNNNIVVQLVRVISGSVIVYLLSLVKKLENPIMNGPTEYNIVENKII